MNSETADMLLFV